MSTWHLGDVCRTLLSVASVAFGACGETVRGGPDVDAVEEPTGASDAAMDASAADTRSLANNSRPAGRRATDSGSVASDGDGGSRDARQRSQPAESDAAVVSDDSDAGSSDGDLPLFETDQVLPIALDLPEQDWDLIRGESRSIAAQFTYCADPSSAYTTVPARVRFDDKVFEQVGLRKKGSMGAVSYNKPALRIEVDEYVDTQRLRGAKTLVLNNSRQDPSYTHQCMAYSLFKAAGVAAPRCGFARVSVNGRDLGTYVNVEPVKKPFLAHHFKNDEGDLYEGNGTTDFRSDLVARFEKKTNKDEPQSPELAELTRVLEQPDGQDILADVERLLDLDQFMRFWAVESLISHWDGYTGNLNNHFVYVHPDTRKLIFIPWGTDGAFERDHAFLHERPATVLAWSRLPRRLYAIPRARERFRSTLRTLLQDRWNEQELLAEVDRIAALLGDAASPDAIEEQRDFIRSRRLELQAELDAAAPEWTIAERPPLMCHPERRTPISGTFSTTWSTLTAVGASPSNRLEIVLDGTTQTFDLVLASAGPDDSGQPSVQVAAPLLDGRLAAVVLTLGELPRQPGTLRFHGLETLGTVVRGANDTNFNFEGYVSEGSITFESVALASGDTLSGRFDGELIALDPELAALLSRP